MYARILVLVSFFVAGCGNNIVPVSGRITLDDKPLANASITFQPLSDSQNPGPGSMGKTNANGEYSLQLMTQDVKGALIGNHLVKIVAYEGDPTDIPSSSGKDNKFRKQLVAAKFNTKSELTFAVPPGGTENADFKVEGIKPETK